MDRARTLDSIVRSYIPRKDQQEVSDLVQHLIMLEPSPADLQAMVSRQQAKYEGRLYGGVTR